MPDERTSERSVGVDEAKNPVNVAMSPLDVYQPRSVKAESVSAPADMTLGDAIETIISSCLEHFVANWPSFLRSDDPESVHQMRVALRRLRAAFSLLRRVVECDDFVRANECARKLATLLGEARDWDVFRESLECGLKEAIGDEPGFFALVDIVELKRAQAYAVARERLCATETSQFVQELRRALSRRSWRLLSTQQGAEAPKTAQDLACMTLDRLDAKARKKCKRLAERSPEARHEARVALKQLRYAAEFFSKTHGGGSEAKSYLRALSKLQERLGADHDAHAAGRLLEAVRMETGEITSFARGFVQGWLSRRQRDELAGLKKSAKTLRRFGPFWR